MCYGIWIVSHRQYFYLFLYFFYICIFVFFLFLYLYRSSVLVVVSTNWLNSSHNSLCPHFHIPVSSHQGAKLAPAKSQWHVDFCFSRWMMAVTAPLWRVKYGCCLSSKNTSVVCLFNLIMLKRLAISMRQGEGGETHRTQATQSHNQKNLYSCHGCCWTWGVQHYLSLPCYRYSC